MILESSLSVVDQLFCFCGEKSFLPSFLHLKCDGLLAKEWETSLFVILFLPFFFFLFSFFFFFLYR
jgi:hypothetical protein